MLPDCSGKPNPIIVLSRLAKLVIECELNFSILQSNFNIIVFYSKSVLWFHRIVAAQSRGVRRVHLFLIFLKPTTDSQPHCLYDA
jgi:hypothetical protein